MRKNFKISILAGALLAVGVSATAFAATAPSSGLGQAWPNAADVSASPHWHVYVFIRDGVRYVQVNDLNGGVRGAIATAAGTILVLPMGANAPTVTDSTTAATSTGETVYSDGAIKITATVQSTGATQLSVSSIGTGCDDPIECSTHVAASAATTTQSLLQSSSSSTGCDDPVECSTHVVAPATTAGTAQTLLQSTAVSTGCDDPVECSTHIVAPAAATTTTATQSLLQTTTTECDDPVECSTHKSSSTP